MRARHALIPGSFDPLTLGHLDLAERALALFGRVTLGIATNPEKRGLFRPEERLELVREALASLDGADAVLVPGLAVDAAREVGANVLVRGARGGADFEFEIAMARTNGELSPGLDTVILAPSPRYAHVSSTLVRQIAALGGDVARFVPPNVSRALARRARSEP